MMLMDCVEVVVEVSEEEDIILLARNLNRLVGGTVSAV
jgi:hypothetical protein